MSLAPGPCQDARLAVCLLQGGCGRVAFGASLGSFTARVMLGWLLQSGDSHDPFAAAERREQQRRHAAKQRLTSIPRAGLGHEQTATGSAALTSAAAATTADVPAGGTSACLDTPKRLSFGIIEGMCLPMAAGASCRGRVSI